MIDDVIVKVQGNIKYIHKERLIQLKQIVDEELENRMKNGVDF